MYRELCVSQLHFIDIYDSPCICAVYTNSVLATLETSWLIKLIVSLTLCPCRLNWRSRSKNSSETSVSLSALRFGATEHSSEASRNNTMVPQWYGWSRLDEATLITEFSSSPDTHSGESNDNGYTTWSLKHYIVPIAAENYDEPYP